MLPTAALALATTLAAMTAAADTSRWPAQRRHVADFTRVDARRGLHHSHTHDVELGERTHVLTAVPGARGMRCDMDGARVLAFASAAACEAAAAELRPADVIVGEGALACPLGLGHHPRAAALLESVAEVGACTARAELPLRTARAELHDAMKHARVRMRSNNFANGTAASDAGLVQQGPRSVNLWEQPNYEQRRFLSPRRPLDDRLGCWFCWISDAIQDVASAVVHVAEIVVSAVELVWTGIKALVTGDLNYNSVLQVRGQLARARVPGVPPPLSIARPLVPPPAAGQHPVEHDDVGVARLHAAVQRLHAAGGA